jgi:hypothetical protein|tara:strand:- start:484 stop:621 length:138 start_codon:yes stop_codon:yes gene_type:complete
MMTRENFGKLLAVVSDKWCCQHPNQGDEKGARRRGADSFFIHLFL